MANYQCTECKHRLQVPDGNLWCGLIMKSVGKGFLAQCPNFEEGSGKVYKPEAQITPSTPAKGKIRTKEIKPMPVTKTIRKKSTKQERLF